MPEQYLAFLIFVAVATTSPGGATTLATASGVRFGVRRSVPLIAGIGIGLGSMAVASAFGLAGLLLAFPALELSVRILGTAYLLHLAWRITTAGSPARGSEASRPVGMIGAAAMAWYNPKAWAVTIGASSSFGNLADGPAHLASLLGLTFLVFAAASMAIWCALGQALRRLLKSERQWHVLNATFGVLLAASVIPMWLG